MVGSPDRWTGTAARPLLLDHLIGGLLGKHRPYGLESLSALGSFHARSKSHAPTPTTLSTVTKRASRLAVLL